MNVKRILVVEDDEVLRKLFKSLLETEGYVVDAMESETTAILRVLDSENDKFGLVLMDIYMSRFGWLHTLNAINMIASRVPVVATMGFMMACGPDVEAQLMAHGAACCLMKPMGINSLMGAVRRYCRS